MSNDVVPVIEVVFTDTAMPIGIDIENNYKALSSAAKGGVLNVRALHTYRHSPEENYARGEVLVFDRNTPALAIASRLRELGGHVSTVALPENAFETRKACRKLLASNIGMLLDDAADAATKPFTLRHGDAQAWRPTLDSPTQFVGVMRLQTSSNKTGAIKPYLVAHTNAAIQSDELREFVEQNHQLTIGQLIESEPYKRLEDYASRNNRAYLYRVAEALGVQDRIASLPDASERPRSAADVAHHCARDLAIPDMVTRYGTLRVSPSDPNSVLFYNRSIDLNASTGNGVLLPLSPLHGIRMYTFREDMTTPATRVPSALVNVHHNSLPLGLPIDKQQPVSISAQIKSDASDVLQWPNKGVRAEHDAVVHASLTRHVEPSAELMSNYERIYLSGVHTKDEEGTCVLRAHTLQPMAVLVRPTLQQSA